MWTWRWITRVYVHLRPKDNHDELMKWLEAEAR